MSFVDKFSCGIVLMLIQNSAETQSENMFFHKYAIVYTCGGASLLGLITIACWYAITLRKRYYHQFNIKVIVKFFMILDMNNVNALIQYDKILISGGITQRNLNLQIQEKTTHHFRTGEYLIVNQSLFEYKNNKCFMPNHDLLLF